MTSTATIPSAVYRCWLPRQRVRTADWVAENVRAPDGAPFSYADYPWMRGVFDAYDEPKYREYWLQWAVRVGKTFSAECVILSQAANDPRPFLFSSSNERRATDTVTQELYPMIAQCPALRDELKPEHKRSMHRIDLAFCHGRVAWSGSKDSLAGFSAFLVVINEVDKHSANVSTEADPVQLAFERQKQFSLTRKAIIEGTPTLTGFSRIERGRLAGTNHQYYVPCHACGEFHVLQMFGTEDNPVGLVWDKLPSGSSDQSLAEETARYVCPMCRAEWYDEHRAPSFRAGIWVPEGCTVKNGEVIGTPRRQGSIWSSQLSGLYSLQRTWGDIASEWVRLHKHPRERQSFYNSTLAQTWSFTRKRTTVEELGSRLDNGTDIGLVPTWVQMLVVSVDVQVDHLVWMVCGYGSSERCVLIDYGIADEWDHLAHPTEGPMYRTYLRDDESQQKAAGVMIDSGFNTKKVYEFCRKHNTVDLRVLPCKGADSMGGDPYRKTVVGKDGEKNPEQLSTRKGNVLILVNNPYWQSVVQDWFDAPDIETKFSIPKVAAADVDLLEQLLNEGQIERVNQRTHQPALIWAKLNETIPNDYRDCLRYNRVMAEICVRRKWHSLGRRVIGMTAGKPEAKPEESKKQRRKVNQQRSAGGNALLMDRPGGWANLGGRLW